jgi:hypothetical protein
MASQLNHGADVVTGVLLHLKLGLASGRLAGSNPRFGAVLRAGLFARRVTAKTKRTGEGAPIAGAFP